MTQQTIPNRRELTTFGTWAQVLDHIRAGRLIWYHAPMDYAPVRVTIARLYKNGKVRVLPPTTGADAFTADSGHLSRFRREVQTNG